MADFLERLVRRTIGQLPVARPDLAPAFGVGTAEPAVPLPPASPAFDAASAPASPIGAPVVPLPRHPAIDDRRAVLPLVVPNPDVASLSSAAATVADAPIAGSESANQRTVAFAFPAFEPSRQPSVEPPAPERSRRAWVADPSAPEPFVSRDVERPTIRISIGRVDVRAVSAPPTSQPASKPHSNPLRSLDSYLAERNGRRS
jgi:hypothetical protein